MDFINRFLETVSDGMYTYILIVLLAAAAVYLACGQNLYNSGCSPKRCGFWEKNGKGTARFLPSRR